MKKNTKIFLLALVVVGLLVFLANTRLQGFQDMKMDKKALGEPCSAPEDCQSNMCTNNMCGNSDGSM